MSNSFLNSFDFLQLSSVTNTESLGFFMASSGASRYTSLGQLEEMVDQRYATELTLGADHVIVARSYQILPYDVASRDPFGLFDSNSVGLLTSNFNGLARINMCISVESNAGDNFSFFTCKNGFPLPGGIHISATYPSGKPRGVWTSHVFTVTSGDFFDIRCYISSAAVTSVSIIGSTDNFTHLDFQPMAIWL